MESLITLLERFKLRWSSIAYDSCTHPAEAYYATIYMDYFTNHLDDLKSEQRLKILDAGCGTGRFSIPLANQGHQIQAIDIHKDSLRVAKEGAEKAGLKIEFINSDLAQVLTRFADNEFDVSMSIEALYICKTYKDIIAHLHRITRKGGLLFITYRTPFYYITQALCNGNFDDAIMVLKNTEGRLLKGYHCIYYNWQTNAQIDAIYKKNGSTILGKYPIGLYSGFSSDAMKNICNTEAINDVQRTKLREVETMGTNETFMSSRYVLVVSQVD